MFLPLCHICSERSLRGAASRPRCRHLAPADTWLFLFFVEKLRRSLPNLTRSSAVAQSPEPVKNSRSCESNLQVPNGSPRHQNQSASEYIAKDVDINQWSRFYFNPFY